MTNFFNEIFRSGWRIGPKEYLSPDSKTTIYLLYLLVNTLCQFFECNHSSGSHRRRGLLLVPASTSPHFPCLPSILYASRQDRVGRSYCSGA